MAKKMCLLPVIFLLVPFVYAVYEESIFNDWVESGDNKTIDGETYYFSLSSDRTRIFITFPDKSTVVFEEGKCKIDGYYDVCFFGSNISYHDYTRDKAVYKAKVKISELIANVVLSRSVDDTSIYIGEKANIKVSFENDGSREATNVKFVDGIADSFLVTNVVNCLKSKNNILWNGVLGIKEKKTCSYTIKSINKTTLNPRANLSYNNGRATKTIYSDITLEVNDYQIQVNASLSNDEINIDDSINLSIKLTNINSNEGIRISRFYVVIPHGINYVKGPGALNKKNDMYVWDGSILLDPGETKEFGIELQGKLSNNYSILIRADYNFNSILKKNEKGVKLKVLRPKLSARLKFDKTKLSAGEATKVALYVENSAGVTLKDIKIKLTSDLPGFAGIEKSLEELKAHKSIKIAELDVTMPLNPKNKYLFKTRIDYKSEQFQSFESEKDYTIKSVIPITETEENITVTQDVMITENLTKIDKEVKKEEPKTNASVFREMISMLPDMKFKLSDYIFIVIDVLIVIIIVVIIIQFKRKRRISGMEQNIFKERKIK